MILVAFSHAVPRRSGGHRPHQLDGSADLPLVISSGPSEVPSAQQGSNMVRSSRLALPAALACCAPWTPALCAWSIAHVPDLIGIVRAAEAGYRIVQKLIERLHCLPLCCMAPVMVQLVSQPLADVKTASASRCP